MENYIVSARKYRPLSFDSVVGQESLTKTLKNAVATGKLAHAYLFCGPRGVGKTTCARIFSKVINCEHPTADGEPCDQCDSCKAFAEQRSFNVFELDAASNNSVNDIRDLLEQTRIPPQTGRYKVFIIDEVHMLSTQAFNAFLKTLEEPPAHAIFILATTEKHKILPTIISRCQIFDFDRMTVPNIVNHLKMVAEKEGIKYDEEALSLIAEKADGGMRDALSVFDQVVSFTQGNVTYEHVLEDLNILDSDYYFKIVELSLENKVADIMVMLNELFGRGYDGNHIVSGLSRHLRNVMMAREEATSRLIETSDRMRARYQEQAKKCDSKFIYKALDYTNRCDMSYRQSSNKRLLVELTLIMVAQITQDDGDSSGRGPKELKTLFKLLTASQPVAAKQVTVADKGMVNAVPKSDMTGGNAVASQPNVAQTTSVATSPSSSASGSSAATSSETAPATPSSPEEKKPAVLPKSGGLGGLKVRGLAGTFSALKKKAEESEEKVEIEDEEDLSHISEEGTFTIEDVKREWNAMCNRMPDNWRTLAMRMKNVSLRLVDDTTIEAVADNNLILSQIEKIKGRIRATLVQKLQNKNITIELRQAAPEEMVKVKTKKEEFDELIKNNDGLIALVKAWDLKLS